MSQIKKGAFLNYATIILTNIVGLLLTPYMIRKFGNGEFGLYTLIGAFVGYISVLDFGLGHTIVRFVAKYRAEKNIKAQENFLATTMLIYFTISLIVVIIGIICYFNLEYIFGNSLNDSEMVKAKIMFVLLVFNLAISLPGGTFGAICTGYEQFVFPRMVNILRYITRSILVFVLLFYGGKAVSVVILDTIMTIIMIIIHMYYVLNILKVRFKLHSFKTSLVKEIFSYSVWIFVFILIAQFQWKTGQVVLGIITDTTVVAIFAVGIMLGGYYGAFSSAITSVFLPRATQMTVANASSEELTNVMIRIGRISFLVLLYILGAFVLYGKQFVFLWVGESYYDAYKIAVIIMLAYTIPLVQGFATSILEARNMVAFKAIVYLIFLVIGTGIGALLAFKYGAIGMISGSVIGWIIGQNIMNFYYQKVIKLNILRFFKELFNKTILAFLIVLSVGLIINYIPGVNWFSFILKSFIYSLVYFLIFYYYAINVYERNLINNLIQKILNKTGDEVQN